jgi:hypothetical protein
LASKCLHVSAAILSTSPRSHSLRCYRPLT